MAQIQLRQGATRRLPKEPNDETSAVAVERSKLSHVRLPTFPKPNISCRDYKGLPSRPAWRSAKR